MGKVTALTIATVLVGGTSALASETFSSAARRIMTLATFAEKHCPNIRVDMVGLSRLLAESDADVEHTGAIHPDEDSELVASLERLRDRPEQMCKAVWKHVLGIRLPNNTN